MELTPEQESHSERIAEEAHSQDPTERHDYIWRASSDDAVREHAERLVELMDLVPDQDVTTRFGRYRVLRRLGAGGMGEVYLSRDDQLNRDVAIKVLKEWGAPEETRKRFISEARTLANIRHPNIVPIYDCHLDMKQPYFVMEYLADGNLADAIRDGRYSDFGSRLRIAGEIAQAVQAVHRAGKLHRDIKPANVFLDSAGVAKLGDFGIAKVEECSDTAPSQKMRTPEICAPELRNGHPETVQSDIYAYGLLLFKLFTGEAKPRSSAGLPPAIADLIHRSTAVDPGERPDGFEEILDELDRIGKSGLRGRRSLARAVALSAAVLVMICAAALLFRPAPDSPRSRSGGNPPDRGVQDQPAPAPVPAPATTSADSPPEAPAAARVPDPPSSTVPPKPSPRQLTLPKIAAVRPDPAIPEPAALLPQGQPAPLPVIDPATIQPPAAAPPQPVAGADKLHTADARRNRADVLETLRRCEAAYRERNIEAIKTLKPTLTEADVRELKALFAVSREIDYKFILRGDIEFSRNIGPGGLPESAVVRGNWVLHHTPYGSRPQSQRQDFYMRLEPRDGRWRIVSME